MSTGVTWAAVDDNNIGNKKKKLLQKYMNNDKKLISLTKPQSDRNKK